MLLRSLPRHLSTPATFGCIFVLCFVANSLVLGQSTTKSECVDGLIVQGEAFIALQPKFLRILLPLQAEEATAEKAVQRLIKHIELTSDTLVKFGAIKESIQISDIKTGLSSTTLTLTQLINSTRNGAPVNWAPQPNFPVAVPAPAWPNAPGADDPLKDFEIPKIYVASSNVSVDWKIANQSNLEVMFLKLKIKAEVQAKKIDSPLTYAYTPEQEDEIFEQTKVDLKSQPWHSNTATASNRELQLHYVGKFADEDYEATLKQAFQAADKNARQIGTAGNLKIGKILSVHANHKSKTKNESDLRLPLGNPYPAYSVVSYSPYTTGSSDSSDLWEPTLKSGEIRIATLDQIEQIVQVSVRYQLQ